MSLLLIRHALAGDSSRWSDDDRLRPLDHVGGRQAAALVDVLAEFPLDRVVSSPYVRCVQTVEPLAQVRGLPVEHDERLGAERLRDVPQVLQELQGENVAVCTHGDLPWLDDRSFEKGSTWELDADGEPARYLPPGA